VNTVHVETAAAPPGITTLTPQVTVHVNTATTERDNGVRHLDAGEFADATEHWVAERLKVFASVTVDDHDATEALLQEGFVLDPGQRRLLWETNPRLGFVRDYSLQSNDSLFLPRIPQEGIQGDDLVLTYPRLSDIDDLLKNDLDPEVRRFSIFGPIRRSALTLSLATAYYTWRRGDSSTLIARSHFSGPPMGTVSVRKLVPPGVLDVGYATLSHCRGRGVAAASVRTFTRWAFESGGVQRIEMGIKPANTASIITAERAGYQRESTRRRRLRNHDGSFSDELSYVAINTIAAGSATA
jgi:RimJ/RimL family protein N-acetyltransferase